MNHQAAQTTRALRTRTQYLARGIALATLALAACGDAELGATLPDEFDRHNTANGSELATATGALDASEAETSADASGEEEDEDEVLERIRAAIAEHAESGEIPNVHVRRVPRSSIESWIEPTPVEVLEDGVCTTDLEYDDEDNEPREARIVPEYVPRVASTRRELNRPIGFDALTEIELTEATVTEFEPPPAALQVLINDYRYRCLHATRQPDADCASHPYIAESARLQAEVDQERLQARALQLR